jgi:hypothetical protein
MNSTFDTSKLTKKELLYWRMMAAKGAVPFIKGRPGEAKTAIVKSIARKLGLQLIDIRLSQMDEIVVTGFPATNPDGHTFSFRTPDWAVRANEKPTIIVFEEYNRAKLEQRNAAMQIMCEREVGMNFKFNENVYMAATGNLGDADGTDVEEIESAQKGRLATINHTLTIDDWCEGYAEENVHPLILGFIKSNPQYFWAYKGDEEDSYASARTWDYLSMFIKENFGTKNVNYTELIDTLSLIGKSYVGSSNVPFMRYVKQMNQISAKDILNRYEEIADVITGFNRPQISEYLTQLAEHNIEKLKEKQVENLIKFLTVIKEKQDDDEIASFFLKIVEQLDFVAVQEDPSKKKNTSKIVNSFVDIKERMQKKMAK